MLRSPRLRRPIACAAALALLAGCDDGGRRDVRPVAEAEAAGRVAVAASGPSDAEIPEGPLGESVRRGRALLEATRDSLPAHVGNQLRCTSCHLDAGRRANAIPWIGVYARFPQYRSRSAAVLSLEDRINDCFARSLNGTPLPLDSRAMRDMVAYMAWLSRGVPVGGAVRGQGLPQMPQLAGDSARGAAVFASTCVACHGASGEGTPAAPPLWGRESYNIGAGMARLRTAAAFIRHNMPYGNPTLTDQQAFDVAAYVNAHARPDFAGKENDWPRGDAPPDVAYPTKSDRRSR